MINHDIKMATSGHEKGANLIKYFVNIVIQCFWPAESKLMSEILMLK
jgi:hypothetical protein